MNNRIKMTDSKFKCNIFLFLSVTVFMARLSIYIPLTLDLRKGSIVRPPSILFGKALSIPTNNSGNRALLVLAKFIVSYIHVLVERDFFNTSLTSAYFELNKYGCL
jgi:hypothetical protein